MVQYLGLLYAGRDSDTVYAEGRLGENCKLLIAGYYGFGNLGLAIAEDPKIERFVDEARVLGALQIPCTGLPSLEEVLLPLSTPPTRDLQLKVYDELHERTQAAFAAFVDELKAVVGGAND